jgi:hypothetical protein
MEFFLIIIISVYFASLRLDIPLDLLRIKDAFFKSLPLGILGNLVHFRHFFLPSDSCLLNSFVIPPPTFQPLSERTKKYDT